MKYRKKPIVIEAYQTDKEIIINTLEGDMKANIGDYIITGVNGEKYPCKSDIFEKTYEQADKQPELSTAEKLLWLIKKYRDIEKRGDSITIKYAIPNYDMGFDGKNIDEAINAAYEWAIAEMAKENR